MRRLIACFVCVGALLFSFGCHRGKGSEPLWELICIDVGQGHCTLLRTPDGDVLVDAGSEISQGDLCQRLKSYGVQRLKLMILTHSDEDHIGGADGILEHFEVEEIRWNGIATENDSFARLIDAVKKKNVPMDVFLANDGRSVGGAHIGVLSLPIEKKASANDCGLVLLIRCGAFGALIMGDASSDVEADLIKRYGAAHLQTDVLLVGHHGASTSTSSGLIEMADPQYAVISCGAGNPYGHPDGRTLARLEAAEVEILRTDLDGDVRFAIYENEFHVSSKGDGLKIGDGK